MTRVDKSPEQLDAEASAPEDRDLEQAIAAHRLLFKAETGILKLHQRDGESGLGPPFNPIFAAYLSEEYFAFPWSKALLHLRWRVCRQTHTEHLERPEWGGSLCHSLVALVIRQEHGLDMARLQLGLPDEKRTRRTLDSALLAIERRLEVLIEDDKAKQSLPAREPREWMGAVHRPRHDQPGLHQAECPQCAA